jgi:hypothetical protein
MKTAGKALVGFAANATHRVRAQQVPRILDQAGGDPLASNAHGYYCCQFNLFVVDFTEVSSA